MRKMAITMVAIIAAVGLAAPAFAAGFAGKIVSIEGDKLAIQVARGDAADFPVGTRGVDIKSDDGTSVRARVVAASGDKITFRVMRGKASSLAAGASVTLEKARKSGSEEMQGC